MAAKDPYVYLMHIRDACRSALGYSALRRGPPIPEQVLLDAVCRRLEIIGEASRKIGPEFRQQHPEIPWREMGSLRNVLIHDYEGTDSDVVWGTWRACWTPKDASSSPILSRGQAHYSGPAL
jgi:uncharacterized protein with HEPN domain